MIAALEGFMASCAAPLVPNAALGISTGMFAEPETLEWPTVVMDDDDVTAARALARIAMPNQVLVTAEVCDATGVQPLTSDYGSGEKRHLHGLQQRLAVTIAPWGDQSRQEIYNLPMLRPELKRLENVTAELLIMSDEIRSRLEGFAQQRIDSNLVKVQRLFRRVAQRVAELVDDFEENSSELKYMPQLQDNLTELRMMTTQLPQACDRVGQQIKANNTSTADILLSGAWEEVIELIRMIHLEADKMVMDIDDGLKVGQPPAWR